MLMKQGERGDDGRSGTPGRLGDPGPPGEYDPRLDTGVIKGTPGPQGPRGNELKEDEIKKESSLNFHVKKIFRDVI